MPKARGEVLAEVVTRAHLQCLAVAHHRFERERVVGAGEALAPRLQAHDDGEGEHVDHEILVDLAEDPDGVGVRVSLRRVRRVPLLPQELAGAQEEPWPQLPADHVGPLVQQQGQVAVALDPLGHELADDGLTRRAHDDRLFELLASCHRDHGKFRAESLDVLRLALEVGLGDEQREVGVLCPARLDAGIDLCLHPFPDRIAVGPDDHRAADRTVVGQLRFRQHVLVPAGKVVRSRRENGGSGHRRRG